MATLLTAEQRLNIYDEATDSLAGKGYDPNPEKIAEVKGAVATFRIIGWERVDEPLESLPDGLNVEDLTEAEPMLRYWREVANGTREEARPDFEWADGRVKGIDRLLEAIAA